jgi:coenzyme PQQ precursor peptide PqqA
MRERWKEVGDFISTRRISMEWEKPEFVETSLACEVSGYANAELHEALVQAQADTRPANDEE